MDKIVGQVIRKSSPQTSVIEVKRIVVHPLYGKRYTLSKRYHAHDPKGATQVGDTVELKETRPVSKLKKWLVARVVGR